jgi:zinc finger BED domain-containing protein 1 (E3 SUMO-protein ligase ZBED1)
MCYNVTTSTTEIWNTLSQDSLVASIIDPRTKSLNHLDLSNRQEAWKCLETIYEEEKKAIDDEVAILPPPHKKPRIDPEQDKHQELFGIFETILKESASMVNQNEETEIDKWKALAPINIREDPLLWWKANSTSFPILSKIAKKYLAVPASQCTSERTFSTSGKVITPTRNRLKPAMVEKLVIWQKNIDVFCLECDLHK